MINFIKEVEKAHFRTKADTGANSNALMIWNMVRQHAGLRRLTLEDLPGYCKEHDEFHVVNGECKDKKDVFPL